MNRHTPLSRYNNAQLNELRRIHDEIKWLAGEKLHYDPDTTPTGRRLVEDTFAQVILDRNAGRWLAGLPGMNELHDMVEGVADRECKDDEKSVDNGESAT